jgi:16S rRNA (cytosine967-C5)-methyltransferase
VTCSPHVAETRGQVAGAVQRWGERIIALDTGSVVAAISGGEVENSTAGEDQGDSASQVQLWPHVDATDAMFIALFRKADG